MWATALSWLLPRGPGARHTVIRIRKARLANGGRQVRGGRRPWQGDTDPPVRARRRGSPFLRGANPPTRRTCSSQEGAQWSRPSLQQPTLNPSEILTEGVSGKQIIPLSVPSFRTSDLSPPQSPSLLSMIFGRPAAHSLARRPHPRLAEELGLGSLLTDVSKRTS